MQLNEAKLIRVIYMLDLLKKIGKSLSYIILGFAMLNTFLAIYDFINTHYAFGVLNTLLAIGGFNLLIQLWKRRTTRSYNYLVNQQKRDLDIVLTS